MYQLSQIITGTSTIYLYFHHYGNLLALPNCFYIIHFQYIIRLLKSQNRL